MKKMKNILICTHYGNVPGLTDIFLDYCLTRNDIEYVIILKNPLSIHDKLGSKITVYKNSKIIDEINFSSLSFFQFPTIWILNLYHLKRVMIKFEIKEFKYFFAFDPLQYLDSFFYMPFIKNYIKIFYNSDYPEKRFNNYILNYMYKFIDRLSLKDCDLYVAPSTKFLMIRKLQGKNAEQLYFASHSFNKNNVIFKNLNERIPFSLVYIGNVNSPGTDFKYIFDGIADLKKTKYPDIKLYIFGDGNLVGDYKKYVASLNLSDTVLFMGIKNHNELFKSLNKYCVGLCPYAVGPEVNGWTTTYCSLFTTKMIEYIANGLPFLTTAFHKNVYLFEKWKVGKVIDPNKNSFIETLDFFFSNSKLLEECSLAAYKISTKYSYDIVYEQLFQKIENIISNRKSDTNE